MTFVLNILHKDFSLLTADRRGQIKGPTTFTWGKTTINVSGKTTVDGVQKLYLNSNASVAVGFSGTTEDHSYLAALKQIESASEVLTLIRKHMANLFSIREIDNAEAVYTESSHCIIFRPSYGVYIPT